MESGQGHPLREAMNGIRAPENGLFTIELADLPLDVLLKDVLANRIGLGTSA